MKFNAFKPHAVNTLQFVKRVFCVWVNRTERDNCFAFNGFCEIVYRRLLGGVGSNAQNDGDVHAVLLHQFF